MSVDNKQLIADLRHLAVKFATGDWMERSLLRAADVIEKQDAHISDSATRIACYELAIVGAAATDIGCNELEERAKRLGDDTWCYLPWWLHDRCFGAAEDIYERRHGPLPAGERRKHLKRLAEELELEADKARRNPEATR